MEVKSSPQSLQAFSPRLFCLFLVSFQPEGNLIISPRTKIMIAAVHETLNVSSFILWFFLNPTLISFSRLFLSRFVIGSGNCFVVSTLLSFLCVPIESFSLTLMDDLPLMTVIELQKHKRTFQCR